MHWLKKQKTQKLFFGMFLFAVISSVLFVVPDFAMAAETVEADSCSAWSYVFCAPAKWMLYAIVYVMQIFASAGLVLFEYVIKPAHIIGLMNLDGVLQLWRFVRDFFNLFFILVLLFSAFATIFQVEQYSLKKIFLSVLLGALLINFSFPITRFLIDTTNVPMYYFANALSPNGTAGGAGQTAMGEVLKASQLTQILIPNDVTDTSFSRFFLAIIFMFLFAITIVVLAIMMFIRVIGLVILVIFSPVGFAASFIPGLSKYSSQWWEKFWSYALFGPSAMLMVFVAVKFLQAVETSAIFGGNIASSAANIASGSADQTTMASMVMFSLPIILIWMAIGTANSFSIAGAGAVTGWGKKIGSYAWKAPWKGVKFGAHKADESLAHSKYGRYLSPGAWKQAFQSRSKEHERQAYQASGAVGDLHDSLNRIIPKINIFNPKKALSAWKGNVPQTDYGYQMRQGEKAKYMKEISEKTGNETSEVLKELGRALKEHDNTKVQAALETLAKELDMNDMMLTPGFGDQYGNKVAEYTPENMRAAIEDMLMKSGADEQTAMRQARSVMQTNFAAGNGAAIGGYEVNKDGTLRHAEADEWAKNAVSKIMSMEPQKRQQFLHENSYFAQKMATKKSINPLTGKEEDNTTVVNADLHDIGAAIAMAIQEADANQAARGKSKTLIAMLDNANNAESVKFQKVLQANPSMRNYIDKAQEQIKNKDQQNSNYGIYYNASQAVIRNNPAPARPYLPKDEKPKSATIDLSGNVEAAKKERDGKK